MSKTIETVVSKQAYSLVFGGLFFDGGRRTSDKETSKVLRLPSENDIEKTRGFRW